MPLSDNDFTLIILSDPNSDEQGNKVRDLDKKTSGVSSLRFSSLDSLYFAMFSYYIHTILYYIHTFFVCLFVFLFLDSMDHPLDSQSTEAANLIIHHHTLATFYFYSIQYMAWGLQRGEKRNTFQTETQKMSKSTHRHTQPHGYQPTATMNVSNVRRLLPKEHLLSLI